MAGRVGEATPPVTGGIAPNLRAHNAIGETPLSERPGWCAYHVTFVDRAALSTLRGSR